jgi:hypothetical protein
MSSIEDTDPAHVVLDALERAGSRILGRNGRHMAQCPNHPDRTPSLSVRAFGDGNVWLHCFAGCETDDVLDRLGLSYPDLYATRRLSIRPDMVRGKEPPEWVRRWYPIAFAVLDVLHDHAFNGPTCHPSQELIAAQIRAIYGWSTTRETVNRVCAWLRGHGLIDWHQERAPGAKWRHNVYRLLCTWVRPLRKRLLERLDRLRRRLSSPTTTPIPSSCPFSVISTSGANGNQPLAVTFGLVGAQPARAGPL